jgi:uncharacterized protein
MLMNKTGELIGLLNLQPHPEGGWFREAYRSGEQIPASALPARYSGAHAFSTSIYYLLEETDFSAFHQVLSDETWHFYLGGPLTLYQIDPEGWLTEIILGTNLAVGHFLQYTVPAGCWFAAAPVNGAEFTLVGCTVAPGFEYADFSLGSRDFLFGKYPAFGELIRRFTRA